MSAWIKIDENDESTLPKPWEKVLVHFYFEGNHPVFVAYRTPENEWDIYQFMSVFKLKKNEVIPIEWMPVPKFEINQKDDWDNLTLGQLKKGKRIENAKKHELKKFLCTWQGDDLEKRLAEVKKNRSEF